TMLVSDWSSDVCSSDLAGAGDLRFFDDVAKLEPFDQRLGDGTRRLPERLGQGHGAVGLVVAMAWIGGHLDLGGIRSRIGDEAGRSEERRVGKEGGCQWG